MNNPVDWKSEDRKLFNIIDQLPAEDFVDVLAEVSTGVDMEVPEESRRKIKINTFQKIGLRPVKYKFSRTLGLALAASLLLAMLGVAGVGADAVWAKLQKALQYIPGINIVVEDQEKQMTRYVLKKPIEKKLGSGLLKIKGVIIDENNAIIEMAGNNLDSYFDSFDAKNIFFRNAAGQQFKIDSYGASIAGSLWTGSYVHRGAVKNLKGLEIVLPDAGETVIPLPLVRAKAYQSYAEMGPTATVSGISITAIVNEEKNRTRINLITPPLQGARIDSYALEQGAYRTVMTLKDNNNREYPLIADDGFLSSRSEFYFNTKGTKADSFMLAVPFLEVETDDAATISIWLPGEKTSQLNKTVKLAGFPVDFEKIERLDNNRVRIYVNVHYDEKADRALRYFSLDGQSYSGTMDERTMAIKTFELQVEPSQWWLKLRLVRPLVVKRGPWEFKIAR